MRYYQDQCVRKNLFPEESKSIQGSDPQAYQGPWMLVITQVPNKDSQSPTLAHLLMPILAPAAGKNAKPTPRGEITARIPTKEDFDIIRRLPVRVYTPPGPNGGTYVLSKVLFDTHARLSIGIFDVNFIIKSVDEFEKSARDAALWHQENAGKDFLANGQPLTWYTQTFGLVQKSGSLIAPNWADV
ncbi:MAG: hypothetical protein M1829_002868 [Trizodia sp. TS-e1964]|nr:MAG: hypothetical protein M1829_002868 [Trizodia sp. TS-e1964]